MMNFDLHPQIILRVPSFPVTRATACLENLLHDQVFRDALYLASDSLYDELCRNDFQLSKCGERMKHTLAKYHKRMCYRPTPFGSFAGLTICNWLESPDPGITIKKHSFDSKVIKKNGAHSTVEEAFYYVSPFIYPYGSDFRLISKSETDNESAFGISEIDGSDLISQLLSGNRIINREELISLIRTHEIGEGADSFISELVQAQILIPHQPVKRQFPISLTAEHTEQPGSSYDSYCSFAAAGALPKGTSDQIRRAVSCLGKICGSGEPEALKEFKTRFEKLFDRQEVPLLQALDPELGIDYDELSSRSASSPGSRASRNMQWSSVHEMLLGKWTGKTGEGIPELKIIDADLAAFSSSQKADPPAISVLFSVCGEKLHVKSAGGVSSLNMIGRFTVLDEEIQNLARELAIKEIQSNPDVVFAELSHIDTEIFASVKRKAILYNYQIPFFEPPELPEEFLVNLNDLYISLANNEIRVMSRRLNKRVIPRFTSAYNYHKSTLPVFRFLCDLQQEGIEANLKFSMQTLFPGLPAYPRVVYNDIILEEASWHLDAKELQSLKKLKPGSQYEAFNALAADLSLPEEFSYAVHDHLLHINRTNHNDIGLLLKTLPVYGKVIFREYFKNQETLITDEEGNGYTHECIAFLSNPKASYQCLPEANSNRYSDPGNREKLFPFDEWLYFKIYLHPVGYADLLLNDLWPFIFGNLRSGNISSWFFVSYYDDDFHLRVRLKLIEGRERELMNSYRVLEQQLRQLPNIRKLELCTYFKERERYSLIGIGCAEMLFEVSSKMVLLELSSTEQIGDPAMRNLFAGVRHLQMVCRALDLTLEDINALSNGFTSRLKKGEIVEFDSEFRANKKDLLEFLTRHIRRTSMETDYLEAVRKAAMNLTPQEKLQVVADLNHMHLNRLYLTDQQSLERKTYYFLKKLARIPINHHVPCFDL